MSEICEYRIIKDELEEGMVPDGHLAQKMVKFMHPLSLQGSKWFYGKKRKDSEVFDLEQQGHYKTDNDIVKVLRDYSAKNKSARAIKSIKQTLRVRRILDMATLRGDIDLVQWMFDNLVYEENGKMKMYENVWLWKKSPREYVPKKFPG